MPVDPLAEAGFGQHADLYERSRPGWPAEAVERVLRELGLGPSSAVLDLAAGTGKLTRELSGRVGRVVAVEPLAAMRAELAAAVPGTEALEGSSEALPLDDASVDALSVAEAFHWFASREAAAEMARVVRPGGGVALLWNVHGWTEEPWLPVLGGELLKHVDPQLIKASRHEPENWAHAFEGSAFGEFAHFSVEHEMRTDVEGLVAHICTWSFVRNLPDGPRAELVEALEAALRREHPTPDDVVLPLRCQVHWARRSS